MQAFLREEDKLSSMQHANPYLYLEEEDAVDADFPDLPEVPGGTIEDERIAAKLEALRKKAR